MCCEIIGGRIRKMYIYDEKGTECKVERTEGKLNERKDDDHAYHSVPWPVFLLVTRHAPHFYRVRGPARSHSQTGLKFQCSKCRLSNVGVDDYDFLRTRWHAAVWIMSVPHFFRLEWLSLGIPTDGKAGWMFDSDESMVLRWWKLIRGGVWNWNLKSNAV